MLRLTSEQEMLRDMVRSFARKEIEPVANEIDETETTPHHLIERCAELGLFGLYTPEEFGGSGTSLTSACIALQEIAKASPALAGLLSVQIVLCPAVVDLLGTPEQKARILGPSASGERLMAYSQTEPAGAANAAFHQSRLSPSGDAYVLNGAKLFCTQGEAETYLIFCKTSREGQEGYGCVVVEGNAPGFTIAPYEDKLGWRGTNTGSISFQDVPVRAEDILGDILTAGVDHKRANHISFIAHSATALGGLEGLYAKTLEYVKERQLYGSSMTALSPVKYWLAEIFAQIQACRALLYEAAQRMDENLDGGEAWGSLCKAHICDTAFECSSRLLQLWGGSGMMNDTGVNRYFRDLRTKMIAEGASEMHYSIVALRFLGLT